MSSYDDSFFDYLNSGSAVSASQVVPLLLDVLAIESVLDVGCGQGAWLAAWRDNGIDYVHGLDGNYVNREQLLVKESQFSPHDLSTGFQLDRRFDLVQSLEVAEHLPASSAAGFIESLTNHGDIVLFSAAPKGQGGDNHVNEQDYNYWRELFSKHDFEAFDYLRPLIRDLKEIEPWYRYNSFLYVRKAIMPALPRQLAAAHVPADIPLPDISPPLYRARKRLVRLLPVSIMTRVAKIKEQLVTARRARR
jgi:SAM-dependent methyltransferase